MDQAIRFFLGWFGLPGKGRALGVGEVKFADQVLPFTYQGEALGKRVAPLAKSLDSELVWPCDVEDISSVDAVFAALKDKWQNLDFIVHCIGFSDRNELRGRYADTTRENFTGELMMCFGVTEPDNGVDTSLLKRFAKKEGGRWLINGRKVWISNAKNADRILLLTRTSPRDPARPLDGMTLFFTQLKGKKGVEITPIEKLARNCIDSNEMLFENFEALDEDIIGEVGKGFRCLLDGLNPERIAVAFAQIGTGRAALNQTVQYAKERIVFDDRQEPGCRASASR